MQLKPYEIVTSNDAWRPQFSKRIVWTQYKNVPIQHLTEAKRLLMARGLKFRIRYRGPRNCFFDERPRSRSMQDCAKRFANRFTAYILN